MAFAQQKGNKKMKIIVVTGANRGIGLEFVKQYLNKGDYVFATCRNPKKAVNLKELSAKNANLSILQMDVCNETEIEQAAEEINQKKGVVDILINNAGYFHDDETTIVNNEDGSKTLLSNIYNVNAEMILYTFQVNSVGPLLVTKAFLKLLKVSKNPKMISLVSGTGVIFEGVNKLDPQYGYQASKAALHRINVGLARELLNDNIAVVGIGPGFIASDMGAKYGATLKASDTIPTAINVIEKLSINDTGKFFLWDGTEQNWLIKQ